MKFGLGNRTKDALNQILGKFEEIEKVSIFGSRAKGTFLTNSDIDLVIENDISNSLLARINAAIIISEIPYKVDLLVFDKIETEELKNEVLAYKRVFYKKNN